MIRWGVAICLCLLSLVLTQDMQIKATFMHVPDIDEDYNVVQTLIYPTAGAKFQKILSGDHFVKKITQIQEAQARAGKPLDRPDLKQQKQDTSNKGDPTNKQSKGQDPYQSEKAQPAIPANNNIKKKEIHISVPNGQQNMQAQKSKINNDGKRIIWRAFDVLPISSAVVEDGVQFKLQKTEPANSVKEKPKEVKNKQVKKKEKETPEKIIQQKPKISPKVDKQTKIEQKKVISIVPDAQKIDKPQQQFHPNLQFTSQPHNKNHITQRKDLIIIVIVLVVAFLIFLVVQHQRTKKENVWSNLTNKLDSYHSSAIQQDDEQEIQNLQSEQESKHKEEDQGESAY